MRRSVGVVLGTVLLAGILTACGTSAPEPRPTQANEAEAKPQAIEEKSPEELEAERIFTLPKPERFDELDAMTLDQFKLESIDARVDYAAWLNRDAIHLAELWHEESDEPHDLIFVSMTVNPENTGDEVLASTQAGLRGAMTRHFEDRDLEEVPNYTPLQREKMATALYLNPDHPFAAKWRTAVADETVNGYVPGFYVKNNILLSDDEVLSRTETSTYTDQNGVERPATDLTLRDQDGQVATATHILVQTANASQWVVAD